jgi:hypothetical protein
MHKDIHNKIVRTFYDKYGKSIYEHEQVDDYVGLSGRKGKHQCFLAPYFLKCGVDAGEITLEVAKTFNEVVIVSSNTGWNTMTRDEILDGFKGGKYKSHEKVMETYPIILEELSR